MTEQVPRGLLSRPMIGAGLGLLEASRPQVGQPNPWGGLRQGLLNSQQARQHEMNEYRAQEEFRLRQEQARREKEQYEREVLNQHMERAKEEARREYFNRYLQSGNPQDLAKSNPGAFQQKELEVLGRAPEKPSILLEKGGEQKLVTPKEAASLVQQGWRKPKDQMTEYQRRSLGLQEREFNAEQEAKKAKAQAAELKTRNEQEDMLSAIEGQAQQYQIVYDTLQDAIPHVDEWGAAGFESNWTQFIRGSDERTMRAMLETITGAIALDKLQEIKKSGATLGQITEKELNILKAAKGAIRGDMDQDDLREALEELVPIVQKLQRGLVEDYDRLSSQMTMPAGWSVEVE